MKLILSEGTGVPFWRQVRDELADRIRSGQLPPGSPLPSIRELAATTLVSVITIKKAYEELERMGLAWSHQGRGTFVANRSSDEARAALHDEVAAEIGAAVRRAAAAGLTEEEIRAACETAITAAAHGPDRG